MAKKEKQICPHCGASMMEHRHVISKELVQSLVALYNQNKPVNLKVLNLTRNAWNNFQKLRYWDLVVKYVDPKERKRKGGWWMMTAAGTAFVKGQLHVQEVAWTFRGTVTKREGARKMIYDIDGKYRNRVDYIRDMKPREEGPPGGQMELC